ncbi:MAG: ABC transporter permease [Thermoguttaceae bacterium]
MSRLRLIIVSLLYHWRMNLAVALGVAAGAAVLTGALLVGDSMHGSLRRLTLDRLGRIDEVLLAQRFFRAELAEELAAGPEFEEHFAEAVPAILLRASLQNANPETPRRANRVNLLGCDERFWKLGAGGPLLLPEQVPGRRDIVLNRPVAKLLGVEVGDVVLLRLPRPGLIPADSPLGRKNETVGSHRLTVGAIVEADGLGRFSLRPSQQLPRNAYLSLSSLMQRLDLSDRVNAIFVAGKPGSETSRDEKTSIAGRLLRPSLEDYGIRVEQTDRGYTNITTDRMVIEPPVVRRVNEALEGLEDGPNLEIQPVLTYLANTIACEDRTLPYSTITAVDFTAEPPLGPFRSAEGRSIGPIGDDQIVLNRWAADDLQARPGDTIRVSYFEPESTHGETRERTESFRLAAVVELANAAADPDFTPKVPGITDQLSMGEWDPPFPYDPKRIREKDETYWDDHRTTPKAFVSLATGRRLWASRFGQTTSLRVQPTETAPFERLQGQLQEQLALDAAMLGFVFQPVKQQGLEASAGTTPFNVLFLSFSFFIIAAAVMLVTLLFRLGIDRRAGELGILTAVGFSRPRIARLLVGEGLVVASMGSLVGVPAGIGYAALMLWGLRTRWSAAVGPPFLQLYVTPTSLAIGLLSSLVIAMGAILWSVRRTRHVTPRQLLAGDCSRSRKTSGSPAKTPEVLRLRLLPLGLLILALGLGLFGTRLDEMAQAGAFFGAGAIVLIAAMLWGRARLSRGAIRSAVVVGRGNLVRMALRNAARNPGRSTLTIGLVASTVFLIVAISAFHLDPAGQHPRLDSGNGGFRLVAETDQPVYHDLDTTEGRRQLGFSAEDSTRLAGATLIGLRVKPGDDASCLNLYRPRQPRVLGIPSRLIERGGFAWAGSSATTDAQIDNPWLLLEQESDTDADGRPLVPVVLDMNTAMYSLQVGIGDVFEMTNDRGETIGLSVVGLLFNSIFQGDLLVGERAFLEHFADVSGYRFFLAETDEEDVATIGPILEETLGDYGLATETTGQRLAEFLAVQNTYLLTFQSLGGLGLLLGTFGLGAVQLRNVLERRGELALLRAAGFRRSTLAVLVMLENGLLLSLGLGCGMLAALVAVLPHLIGRTAVIPWPSLAGTLLLVLTIGLIAGLGAVRAVLRAPLLGALREER